MSALGIIAQDSIMIPEVGVLSNILHETSGLKIIFNERTGNFEGWSHNDHENTDSIYSFKMNDLSNITRTINLNMPNSDWEDMATDQEGNLYVGDFGSFSNSDLHILKLPDPNSFSGAVTSVEKIKFTYPLAGIKDMEAMIVVGDSIYLFSKQIDTMENSNLAEGKTYVFSIPKVPAPGAGTYLAKLTNSIYTRLVIDILPGDYRVTAADISPDNKVLALLCYNRLWIFSCFEGTDFFGGTSRYVDFVHNQKEGIAFRNNHELFITKEGKIGSESIPKLYYLDIEDWIDDSCLNCNKTSNVSMNDLYGWTISTSQDASADLSVVNGQAKIDVTVMGDSYSDVNFRQKGLVLVPGKTYEVTFDAYADHSRTITSYVSSDTYSNYYYDTYAITTSPETYSYEFTVAATDYNARISFGLGKEFNHAVYLDNIRLQDKSCDCPITRFFEAPMDNTVEHFSAHSGIEISNVISSSSTLTFSASDSISLAPGFELQSPAMITLDNNGCSN